MLTFQNTNNEVIIPNDKWADLLNLPEIKKLLGEGQANQWIFRALIGKWDEDNWNSNISITPDSDKKHFDMFNSSFDAAWKVRDPKGGDNPSLRPYHEAHMLLEFKREAHNHLAVLPKKDDYLEWLALARHYGMPTRMVDFSYSFYVAAYFSLSRRKSEEAGCILAINLSDLKNYAENDLRTDIMISWKDKPSDIEDNNFSFHDKRIFHYYAFKRKKKGVVPVAPFSRNLRIGPQQGLFLCPGDIESTFSENLAETLTRYKIGKALIKMPASLRQEAINDLRRMNISSAVLFPDLGGLAESQRDSVHRDFDDRDKKELLISLDIDNLRI